MNPKVSVVVLVYNTEKYIERCAKSLFEQTLDNIEYVFVNDCTPDRSVKVLEDVLQKYPQRIPMVKIINLPENKGQALARQIGIKATTGEYIIHCDSDDWIDKTMYEKLWTIAKQGDYDIVRCNFVRTDGNKEKLCKQIPLSAYDDKYKLLSYVLTGSSLTSLCDKLIRRKIIDNNEIIYPVCNMQEDAALVTQFVFYSNRIFFLPEKLYFYFNNSSSISHRNSVESFFRRVNEVQTNTNLIIQFLEKYGVINRFKDEIICKKYDVRCHLLGLIGEKSFYEKWYSIYPEIDGKIFLCRKMYLYDKVIYALVKLKLYSFLHKLK